MWILFLVLTLLAGISTITFVVLLILKKKHAVLGLSISGGALIIVGIGFFISSGIALFNQIPTEPTEVNIDLDDDDYELDEEPDVPEGGEGMIKAGTYKIGDDIPAGEYLVFGSDIGYIEYSEDSTGELESIIFNDSLLDGLHTYVTVEDDNYLKLQQAVMFPVDTAPSIVPDDGIYRNGVFKVGEDIPEGEYKAIFEDDSDSAFNMGFVEVSSSSSHDYEDIIANETVETETYITVSDGQYLKLDRVYIEE